jgi:hypothetical protein
LAKFALKAQTLGYPEGRNHASLDCLLDLPGSFPRSTRLPAGLIILSSERAFPRVFVGLIRITLEVSNGQRLSVAVILYSTMRFVVGSHTRERRPTDALFASSMTGKRDKLTRRIEYGFEITTGKNQIDGSFRAGNLFSLI